MLMQRSLLSLFFVTFNEKKREISFGQSQFRSSRSSRMSDMSQNRNLHLSDLSQAIMTDRYHLHNAVRIEVKWFTMKNKQHSTCYNHTKRVIRKLELFKF